MKKIVLCVTVLFFGIVKPKAQIITAPAATTFAAYAPKAAPVSTSLYNKQRTASRSFMPVELIGFKGCIKNKRVSLEWSIARNESAERFEVERSANGKDFKTTGLIFSSEKTGTEDYAFFEKSAEGKKIFYRLKLIDKTNASAYSNVLTFYNEKKKEARRLMNGNKPVYC